MKIYLDGKFLEEETAEVPVIGQKAGGVLPPEHFLGAGLAESMRISAGRIPLLAEHCARLAEAARAIGAAPAPVLEIRKAAVDLIRVNRLKAGSIRLRYFGLSISGPRLLLHPFRPRPFPKEWQHGIRLLTVATRHYGAEPMQGRLKSNSMLANWHAQMESRTWAEDGLRLTPDGLVAEGIWSNILAIKGITLFTPRLSQGILQGTTRQAFIRQWKSHKGHEVMETPLSTYDLYTADAVWICSSLRGPIKVREVDGRKIGALL